MLPHSQALIDQLKLDRELADEFDSEQEEARKKEDHQAPFRQLMNRYGRVNEQHEYVDKSTIRPQDMISE